MLVELSLLDYMAGQTGCTSLSDLRSLSPVQRRHLARRLEKLAPKEEDLGEWNDALLYLTSTLPEHSAAAAKARLVCFLKQCSFACF